MAKKKEKDTASMVEEFKSILMGMDREGMEDLIAELEDGGFFTAPCSGGYHLATEGGLLEHSLNVLHLAEKISAALIGAKNLTPEFKNSVALCALLHDIGKMGQFGKNNYVPNILKSGGQSTAKPFKTNPELLPIDHEIRSVAIATMYVDLTEDEQFAILYHNGLYGNLRYAIKDNETPLYMIIHWADMWASRVDEVTEGKADE